MTLRHLLTTLVLCFCSALAWAQMDWDDPAINYNWDNNRHQFTLHGGFNSLEGVLLHLFDNAIQQRVASLDDLTLQKHTYVGSFGLTYTCDIKQWLRVGAKTYVDINKSIWQDEAESTTTHTLLFISLTPAVQFLYLNKNKFRLYSGIDAGVTLVVINRQTLWMPALNITPIGLSYGRAIYGMLETNIGSDALVKAGIGMRL